MEMSRAEQSTEAAKVAHVLLKANALARHINKGTTIRAEASHLHPQFLLRPQYPTCILLFEAFRAQNLRTMRLAILLGFAASAVSALPLFGLFHLPIVDDIFPDSGQQKNNSAVTKFRKFV